MKFRELKLRRDPELPDLRRPSDDQSLIDYEQFCGVTPGRDQGGGPGVPETTVEELKARVDAKKPFFLLDVREPHEYQICRIAGSTLIPLGELPNRLAEIPRDQGDHRPVQVRTAECAGRHAAQGERHRGEEPQGRDPGVDR